MGYALSFMPKCKKLIKGYGLTIGVTQGDFYPVSLMKLFNSTGVCRPVTVFK